MYYVRFLTKLVYDWSMVHQEGYDFSIFVSSFLCIALYNLYIMPKTILFSLFFGMSLGVFAQSNQRLEAVYGPEWVALMLVESPHTVDRLNFYLDNSYTIVELPADKANTYGTVEIADLSQINILQLEHEQKIRPDMKISRMYQIKGTNKVLVYISGQQFVTKWNTHRGLKTPDLNRAVRF
jgi:hypothetical protein